MIRRFSAWANRNPLAAIWLGFVAAFLLMYVAVPSLIRHADHPAVTHSQGTA
jgi:hypothetical protein